MAVKKKTEKTEEKMTFEMTFEEAYEKLENAANAIISDDIPLEQAVECYREGRKYYEICSSILKNAEQLIQIYDKETDTVKEFQENE